VKSGKYLSYDDAKSYLKEKNLKNRKDFLKYITSNYIENIPKNPSYVYRENWISISDFLSTEKKSNLNQKRLIYSEALCKIHKILENKKINTKKDWIVFYEKNLDLLKDIPKNPQMLYKSNGWKSWSEWLNTEKSKSDKNEILLDEILIHINNNKIRTREEYMILARNKILPTNPISKYKLSKWSDILYKKEVKKRGNYLDFNDAKKITHGLSLKSQKEWYILCKINKIPEFVPKTPNKYYNEWVSWNDWLGHDITTYKKFISYKKAKDYLSEISITSLQEYYDYVIENKIDFLPLQPHSYYGKEYKSIDDFLTLNLSKTPYGEKKIINFLEKNKITYSHQYKFKDCLFINRLIFDFFIPDKNTCIEFDGRQHFEPIEFFGGKKEFENIKIRDGIKNKYCLDNGINMIRISYEDINIIDIILNKKLKV